MVVVSGAVAQSVPQKLAAAVAAFEADSQMRHAILGFCVVDSKTGKPVYEHNTQIGLAPASTQKLFTSAAAFELLGQQFRFTTYLLYNVMIKAGVLEGDFFVVGQGDPTFGSWRWKETKDSAILNKIIDVFRKHHIQKINGNVWINDIDYTTQPLPGGWIWDDIGNYYGAGCWTLNWHENQYDLTVQSPACCDPASVVKISPALPGFRLTNFIHAGLPGSGDEGYIYAAPYSSEGFATGSVPPNQNKFTIAGAMPDPALVFGEVLKERLLKEKLITSKTINRYSDFVRQNKGRRMPTQTLDSIVSPPLDSINYWFLKRSINLYGEALVKAIGYEKELHASTETGVEIVRNFWKEQGIEKSAVHMVDGSGLSPQNRVTTDAMVKVLQYAKTRPWYNSFNYALPEYNGMKMKSGSIGGARAFGGYHTAKDGTEYIFSIIVNNYDGSSGEAVKKLYKILDVLK